jgi:hypothetical protein
MAISIAQYVDLLFKKLQGVAKTANSATKSASNESIASPAFIRGDVVWMQADQITSTAGAIAGISNARVNSNSVQCVGDTTVPPIGGIRPTWLSNVEYWIPQEFGSSWLPKVYVGPTSAANIQATGTQIFSAGIGGVGEYYFDTQAGVLNFIGETIPTVLTAGNVVYIAGYEYVGALGVTNNPGNVTIGNLTVANTTVSTTLADGNITLAATGNGLVTIAGTGGITIPSGNTDQRPATPVIGTVRFNTFTENLETYTGNAWIAAGSGGNTFSITNQTVSPDGSSLVYTLDQAATSPSVLLTINGVNQTPDIDYSVVGNVLTMSSPPEVSDLIQVRFLAGLTTISALTNSVGNAAVAVAYSGNIDLQPSTGHTVNVTGNINADYFIGNGSLLTGITGSYGNSNVVTLLSNIGSNSISTTGNVSGGYIFGNGSQLANVTANSTQVTYLQGDTGSVTRTVTSKFQETASVKDFGAVGDGVTNDTAAITAAITATASGTLIFPEGSYLINNSSGPFAVSNFQGEMIFLGNAKLLFSTNTKGGISFTSGSNAKIYNIRIDYVTPPTTRTNAQEGIAFYSTTDTTVTGVYVESSPAAGLLFGQCIRPQVSGVVIESSQADGVHFNNCQDPQIDNLITVSTGDDGLAFVNYASQADYSGGTATNIIIRNSKSRGIAVVGQSDITISNFLVDGTASSGIFTAYDSSYATRYPAQVNWSSGVILNAGIVTPLIGNQFGIEYADVVSVKYNDIQVINSASRGMSGTTAANGLIEASDVTVDSATTNNGFNLSGDNISINNLFANNIQSYGIYVSNSTNVLATNLKTLNVSKAGGLNRAVWFDTVVQLLVDGVEVIDNQGSATGYIVGSASCTKGSVSSVNFAIANGTGQISPVGSGISYPLTNYGPDSTNILFGTGTISGTGNITAGNIIATLNGSGSNVTSISATNISSGTLAQARLANSAVTVNGTSISLGGSANITATATGALTIGTGLGGTSYNGSTGITITNSGVLSLANGGGITANTTSGAITLGSTATSAATAGAIVARDGSGNFSANTITVNGITNSNSNAVGNIGSSSTYFDTVFAKSTSAQYADLAEKYTSDRAYAPGTVLVFGGASQVTECVTAEDHRAAGVVSTLPAHLMNAELADVAVAVALAGQVPCCVVGPVAKGDVLTTSTVAGHAHTLDFSLFRPGCVIGKALENCGPGRHKILISVSH